MLGKTSCTCLGAGTNLRWVSEMLAGVMSEEHFPLSASQPRGLPGGFCVLAAGNEPEASSWFKSLSLSGVVLVVPALCLQTLSVLGARFNERPTGTLSRPMEKCREILVKCYLQSSQGNKSYPRWFADQSLTQKPESLPLACQLGSLRQVLPL